MVSGRASICSGNLFATGWPAGSRCRLGAGPSRSTWRCRNRSAAPAPVRSDRPARRAGCWRASRRGAAARTVGEIQAGADLADDVNHPDRRHRSVSRVRSDRGVVWTAQLQKLYRSDQWTTAPAEQNGISCTDRPAMVEHQRSDPAGIGVGRGAGDPTRAGTRSRRRQEFGTEPGCGVSNGDLPHQK
jgi:hypothetical protein